MEKELKLSLFDEIKMGDFKLTSRIAMAAMTRQRADEITQEPSNLHVRYYSERAEDAAFVLTECTGVSIRGNCFPGATSIFSKSQVKAWKIVTEEVHKKKGLIFLQIFHGGRCGAEDVLGGKPLAPSKLTNRFMSKNLRRELVPCVEPIEMTKDDIKLVIDEFYQGALNAKEAGFDGIELHGANGYLVDQFLRDSSNIRKDEYGGSIENRCRFLLEVIEKFIEVFGAGKVGVKLSLCGRLNDMWDTDPLPLGKYLFSQLGKRKIAFIELMQPPDFRVVKSHYDIPGEEQIKSIFAELKPFFRYEEKLDYEPCLIGNNNLDLAIGNELLINKHIDMVTFGRMYISNPDLIYRLKNNIQLTDPNPDTFYTSGEEGYTTYKKIIKINESKENYEVNKNNEMNIIKRD